jgi:dTDP-4-dehydrorhamnose reductase
MTVHSADTFVLLGSAGMLGRAFNEEFARRGCQVFAPPRPSLDLASATGVHTLPAILRDLRPRAVINCAAWTDVDGAETNEPAATRVNAHAVAELALHCAATGVKLVNFGTDYVFAGDATSPYKITQPRAPLNAYGRSKALAEELLERLDPASWLHVRTSWLYAPWGKNFVRTMRTLLLTKPEIKVVNDQRGRPTSAQHLAKTTLALLDARAQGIHHATDAGECTWFEFAQQIGTLANAPGIVKPCTSAEFPRPAKRPAYSVLDITQTQHLVGPPTHWRDALATVIACVE